MLKNNADGSSIPLEYYDGSQVLPVYAGDDIALTPPASGYWEYFTMESLNGTPTQPLNIRNNGQVKMISGMSFTNCSYINIDGSHVSKTENKGIYIEGSGGGVCLEFAGLCHHIKLFHVKTRGASYAARIKNEANSFLNVSPGCGIEYMFPSYIHDFEIAYMDSSEHSQDGIYFGSSDPWGVSRSITCAGVTLFYRPTALANFNIHHNTMSYCGRSGYQIGCLATGSNSFHDNTIFETGFEYAVDQGAGMAVGGANNSIEIYNNNISRTFREPVYSYNFGQMYLHNNIFDQAGTISVDPLRVFFWTKINLNVGQTLSSLWMDSSPGKTIKDDLGEYYFEFFLNESGNPLIKSQRINNAESTSEFAIPTSHPSTVTLTIQSGRSYSVGQIVRVVNMLDKTKWFKMTTTSYNSVTGVLVGTSISNTGTGTFRSWAIYKETRLPEEAIAAISQTAPGSHLGTQADPYVGFGASSAITSGQVSYPSEISIPGGNAVGNFQMNCYDTNSIANYGSPAGLTTFRIENNTFGTQRVASSAVIRFLNNQNLYGTGNIICGNTYNGSALIEGNITKPGGSVVTYTLNSTC
jgi:hypothetical protein